MSEKSEEQIANERAAVDAMRNAKANMTAALDRISTLEKALTSAQYSLSNIKQYIANGAYTYPSDSSRAKKCHDVVDDAVAAIAKVLA